MLSQYCWLVKKIILKSNEKTNQKDLVEMPKCKTTCPRWHLGQVGYRPFGVPFDQFSQ